MNHLLQVKIFLPGFVLVFLFTSININASINAQNYNKETDSLLILVQKCPTDTGKFAILRDFFWKYAATDMNRVKYVGEWAYYEIKNSNDLKTLSDGYDIKGYILDSEKNFDSANIFYLKALDISIKTGYTSRTLWCYSNLERVNKSLGRMDSVLIYMKKRYRVNVENLYMEPACDNLNEIGSYYEQIGQADSALYYYGLMLELSRQIKNKEKEMFAYFSFSNLYNTTNNTEQALANLNKALTIAEDINADKARIYIYTQIGNLFLKQKKNYKIALVYYQKALEICQAKDKYNEAITLNEIGNLYLEQGNDSLALEYTLKGLQKSQEINFIHQVSIAYKNLGTIYKHQGKLQDAINNFKTCYDRGCDQCPKITFHSSLIDIADAYLKLNNREKALEYYNESMKLAEESKSYNELAISNLKIGNYYRPVNENVSEKYYLTAIEMARKGNDIRFTKTIADTLSFFAKKKHDYLSAFVYQSLARQMGDSIYKIEQQSSMADWELKFEFEKINTENKAKKEEIEKQRLFRYGAISIIGLLNVLGIVVFASYRRIKKANKQLTAKNYEIEKISKQLHDSDQSKIRFFANISHELRTPLTLIVSPLARLLKGNANEDTRKVYSLMLRNSRKLQDLISQLLDISKIDKTELTLNLGLNDFNKQIKTIAAMFQSLAEEKKIEFTVSGATDRLVFCYDAERMEQIINNLLSNAFKFTPKNGKIDIFIGTEDANLILKIRDNGLGIHADSLDKVFDRFYQTDAGITRHFEGSGIGLALAKELTELHKGKISVQSEMGKWTEFTVSIPMLQEERYKGIEDYVLTMVQEDIPTIEHREISKESGNNQETILLVEDNTDLRSYIRDSLSANYYVIEATNGNEGFEMALKETPDIIISDVMMPESDGYQLTSKIREHIETSHIPIILLTAKAGRDSKIEGLERGADDYINKPFDEDELLLKIKNIIHNRQKLQEKFKKQNLLNPSEIKGYSIEEQFIKKLVAFVENDLVNVALDVDYLACNIGLSRQQLYRKLKAITGMSPVEFIRSIRLKRAEQLIRQKTASISEIAFLTGFENLSYFTKRFKEEFGQLPSEYTKSES